MYDIVILLQRRLISENINCCTVHLHTFAEEAWPNPEEEEVVPNPEEEAVPNPEEEGVAGFLAALLAVLVAVPMAHARRDWNSTSSEAGRELWQWTEKDFS